MSWWKCGGKSSRFKPENGIVVWEDSAINYVFNSMRMPWFYYLAALVLLFLLIWRKQRISLSLGIAYMFLVFASTVLSRYMMESYGSDWTPLRLLQMHDWWKKRDLILQIEANILMFIPIGLLLSPAFGWESIIIAFAFSMIIELCQLVFHRGFSELDDVIHNTAGAVLGYGIYKSVCHLLECRAVNLGKRK